MQYSQYDLVQSQERLGDKMILSVNLNLKIFVEIDVMTDVSELMSCDDVRADVM